MDNVEKLLRNFGANTLAGGAVDSEIDKIERKIGWSLPSELRVFYRQYWNVDSGDPSFRLVRIDGVMGWIKSNPELSQDWGFVPIVDRNDSDPFCFCCKGPLTGFIVQCYHDGCDPVIRSRSIDGLFALFLDDDAIFDESLLTEFGRGKVTTPSDKKAAEALLAAAGTYGQLGVEFAVQLAPAVPATQLAVPEPAGSSVNAAAKAPSTASIKNANEVRRRKEIVAEVNGPQSIFGALTTVFGSLLGKKPVAPPNYSAADFVGRWQSRSETGRVYEFLPGGSCALSEATERTKAKFIVESNVLFVKERQFELIFAAQVSGDTMTLRMRNSPWTDTFTRQREDASPV